MESAFLSESWADELRGHHGNSANVWTGRPAFRSPPAVWTHGLSHVPHTLL